MSATFSPLPEDLTFFSGFSFLVFGILKII